MEAKVGDLIIYQTYGAFDDTYKKYWNTEVSIVKENSLDYYNKRGNYEDCKSYVINYIIPKEMLEKCKVEEIKKINDKI